MSSEKISIKGLLQRKYLELQVKCIELEINTDLFEPVTDQTDWTLVVNTVLSLFPDENNISESLEDLLYLKSITLTDKQKEGVCDLIKQYLLFLNKIRKYL